MLCRTAVVWIPALQCEHRRVVTLPLDTVLQMPLLLLHQLVHILPQPLNRRARSHVQAACTVWDVQRAACPHASVQCESLFGIIARHACLRVFEFDLVPWAFDRCCISVIVGVQTFVVLLEGAGELWKLEQRRLGGPLMSVQHVF